MKLQVAGVCVGVLLGGVAWSAQGPAEPGRGFDVWDRDGDGKLTREELPEPLRKNFDWVDRDRNGFISREEDAAVRRGPRRSGAGGGPPGAGPGGMAPEGVRKLAELDYVGGGNPRQMLDLYLPEKPAAGKLPVVCWIHGGGWKNGSKESGAGKLARLVATGKYAGVALNYRLTGEAPWPAQIHDCKAAIRWIRGQAEERGLDPDRIAVWGSSAGGHLVAMLGVSQGVAGLEGELGAFRGESSAVKCVVDFFGPTDLLAMDAQGSTMDHNGAGSPESLLVGGPVQERAETARQASPLRHVSQDDAPALLVHGTEDPLVPFAQSVELAKALKQAGVPAAMLTVEGGGHGQGFGPEVEETVLRYLGQKLLGEAGQVEDGVVQAVGGRR